MPVGCQAWTALLTAAGSAGPPSPSASAPAAGLPSCSRNIADPCQHCSSGECMAGSAGWSGWRSTASCSAADDVSQLTRLMAALHPLLECCTKLQAARQLHNLMLEAGKPQRGIASHDAAQQSFYTAQHSTAPYSTAQHSTAQHSTAQQFQVADEAP